ncbi:MAG: potassium-transporting ATPase subunit C [Ignavibacteriaceae bacterium]|jgi:K+-transporting ATPase ATPase C chain
MLKQIKQSVFLLTILVVVSCIIYPLILWAIGQTAFPFQANGSMLKAPNGTVIGSKLIAQPFTKDEYFQPRPSAASYDGSASSSSALAVSNYALRGRVAQSLGPIVKYNGGSKSGQLIAPDLEQWFQQDKYQGSPHIVAQWADLHNGMAVAWVSADSNHANYINNWASAHTAIVSQWIKNNPATPQPAATDLAVVFFENYSNDHPGTFPSTVTNNGPDGKPHTSVEIVKSGTDIQSNFFDMWRQDHPDVALQNIPGDLVTASGSGLDPDITLQNAEYQLDRVSSKWATDLKRDPSATRKEIEQILNDNASAAFGGIAGDKFVNVLEVNLALNRLYGNPN